MNRRSFVSLVTKSSIAAATLGLSNCSPSEKNQRQQLYDIYFHMRRCNEILGGGTRATELSNEIRFYTYAENMVRIEKKANEEIDGYNPEDLRNAVYERFNASSSYNSLLFEQFEPMFAKIHNLIHSDTAFSNEFSRRVTNNRYNMTFEGLIEDYMSTKDIDVKSVYENYRFPSRQYGQNNSR